MTSAPLPLVSLVIPAYRSRNTLGGTITGALTQTYPRVEVIVVDDGSPDDTIEVARGHGDAVRIVSKTNGGVGSARNAGAAAAHGELVAFCDADDIYLPPAVASMVAAYDAAGGGRRAVMSNAYTLTAEGINPRRTLVMDHFPPPQRQRIELLRRNFASVFAMFPRAVFDELGGYDESLPVIEDWDLWIRAAFSGVELVYQRRPEILYRWTAGSMSADRERMFRTEEELLARFADTWDHTLTPDERDYLAQRIAAGAPSRMREEADLALRAGDVARARRLYADASALQPADRKLALRAWSMRLPVAGELWRRRLSRIDAATGRAVGTSQADDSPR